MAEFALPEPLTPAALKHEVDKVSYARVSAVKVSRTTFMRMWRLADVSSRQFDPNVNLTPLGNVQIIIDDSVPPNVLQPFAYL